MTKWKCSVCGFEWDGDKPPGECPLCSSGPGEFFDISEKKRLEVKPCDILLINGSSHRSHNTSVLVDFAQSELKKRKANYMRVNLNEIKLDHCWCCYSIEDQACTYPCRNQQDDMHVLHKMIVDCKAVIVVSPINWNGVSARLKDFLDRTTCLENIGASGRDSLTAGKVVAILVNGHEDGAVKTAMDIFLYFQQMGFVMAPFGFAYATHGAGNVTSTDNEFFKNNEPLRKNISAVVSNVLETLNLETEKKLKGRLFPVCE